MWYKIQVIKSFMQLFFPRLYLNHRVPSPSPPWQATSTQHTSYRQQNISETFLQKEKLAISNPSYLFQILDSMYSYSIHSCDYGE